MKVDVLENPKVWMSVMRVAGGESHSEGEREGMLLANSGWSGMKSQELGVLIDTDDY